MDKKDKIYLFFVGIYKQSGLFLSCLFLLTTICFLIVGFLSGWNYEVLESMPMILPLAIISVISMCVMFIVALFVIVFSIVIQISYVKWNKEHGYHE